VNLAQNVQAYLSVENGEAVVEPLPGFSFAPDATRRDVYEQLREAMNQGGYFASVEQGDGATYFTVVGPRGRVVLVFDDDSDRLVTICPLHAPAVRAVN
jgi:hypothetical protein